MFALALPVAIILATGGCSDSSSPTSGNGGGTQNPPATLTFQDFVGPLFQSRCTNSGCHGTTPGANNFNVLSYNAVLAGGTTSAGKGIVPNDMAASIVFQKISPNPPFGLRMPRNGPPYLPQSTIDSIALWINAGAPNTP